MYEDDFFDDDSISISSSEETIEPLFSYSMEIVLNWKMYKFDYALKERLENILSEFMDIGFICITHINKHVIKFDFNPNDMTVNNCYQLLKNIHRILSNIYSSFSQKGYRYIIYDNKDKDKLYVYKDYLDVSIYRIFTNPDEKIDILLRQFKNISSILTERKVTKNESICQLYRHNIKQDWFYKASKDILIKHEEQELKFVSRWMIDAQIFEAVFSTDELYRFLDKEHLKDLGCTFGLSKLSINNPYRAEIRKSELFPDTDITIEKLIDIFGDSINKRMKPRKTVLICSDMLHGYSSDKSFILSIALPPIYISTDDETIAYMLHFIIKEDDEIRTKLLSEIYRTFYIPRIKDNNRHR